ncbi:MAG: hypothetical protein HOP07_16630 [Bacteriovoracaceae bacterium]|nr:hypothetical protein [Bacteriovoracaceae bacterium]
MLIAPIIEAIKELKTWIFGIESEVKLHKREIANLKATNEKLFTNNV